MKASGRMHIGTSGWHYNHWKGNFYPRDISSKEMLLFYSSYFQTTEINSSFYRLPSKETLNLWKKSVPSGFVFSMKGSRYITHMKKLKDPINGVPQLLEAAHILGDKLGPILFQLPPHWRINLERLETFLRFLPRNCRYSFEFRDPSWFTDQTYAVLAKWKAAFCISHLAGRLWPKEVTADFVYARLHGPGKAYEGQYEVKMLSGWVDDFLTWQSKSKEIFCYFDNDQAGYAAHDALSLKQMLIKAVRC